MYAPLLVRKRFVKILPFKKYYPAVLRCGLRSKLGCETLVNSFKILINFHARIYASIRTCICVVTDSPSAFKL